MDSVATLAPGYADEPLVYLGGTRIQLVVGQIDNAYQFTGKSIAVDGTETATAFQVNPDAPAIYRIMGRAPPAILNIPQPGDRFIGLAGEESSIYREDNPNREIRLFHISQTVCTEGYVLSPSPGYVERLTACLTKGRCDP